MTLKITLVATALAVASSASMADAVVSMLDLSNGNARFGRDNAVGSFMDTYTFSLASSAYLVSATASSAASGSQDLDYSSLQIADALSSTVATFVGNLGDDQNEFYSLPATLLAAGNYQLLIRGINSPSQASYSGNLAISVAPTGLPEPGSLSLMLASLGAAVLVTRRRPARGKA